MTGLGLPSACSWLGRKPKIDEPGVGAYPVATNRMPDGSIATSPMPLRNGSPNSRCPIRITGAGLLPAVSDAAENLVSVEESAFAVQRFPSESNAMPGPYPPGNSPGNLIVMTGAARRRQSPARS